MESKWIFDMHCHPAIRPYSRSIKHGRKNNRNPRKKWSIWHYNPPRGLDKTLNRWFNLTKFSQANFSELAKGDVKIISACLYPIEHGFGSLRGRKGIWPDCLFNLISEIGYTRINEIQDNQDYFQDLEYEYEYYKELDGRDIELKKGGQYQYKLIKSFTEIPDCKSISKKNIIWVVLSIEGGHVFNCGMEIPAVRKTVIRNIDRVKNWDHRPLFISIAHHFYNELCGHDESFPRFLKKRLNQFVGMHGGFTQLGREVVERLLDNSEGKRILIDIKHMSTRSREEYYNILDKDFKTKKIPIIVSHAAVNGLKSFDDRRVQIENSQGKFNRVYINIFDDEIVKICDSGGFLGIQLDERRIASKSELLQSKGKLLKWKRLYKKSEIYRRNEAYKRKTCSRENLIHNMSLLVWYQIQHIAEVLDLNNKFAWGTAVLGSDFDGLIDPTEVFWTAKDLRYLEDKLLELATDFMNNAGQNMNVPANRSITAQEIVNNFLRENACDFLATFYQ